MNKNTDSLPEKIKSVKRQLANAKARMPKHDIPMGLMTEVDELEEELARLEELMKKPKSIPEQIAILEQQLAEARARIPKHDIPSALMSEIDELEEELANLRNSLQA